jgi:hypothetical protein
MLSLACMLMMIGKYSKTLINLIYEVDHVFNLRPGGILACVKFGLGIVTPPNLSKSLYSLMLHFLH